MPLLQVGLMLGTGAVTPLAAQGVLLSLIKGMFIVAGLIYVIFAVIVTRQVHIMKQTLITSFSPFILLLGYAHLLLALFVFVFFLGL